MLLCGSCFCENYNYYFAHVYFRQILCFSMLLCGSCFCENYNYYIVKPVRQILCFSMLLCGSCFCENYNYYFAHVYFRRNFVFLNSYYVAAVCVNLVINVYFRQIQVKGISSR